MSDPTSLEAALSHARPDEFFWVTYRPFRHFEWLGRPDSNVFNHYRVPPGTCAVTVDCAPSEAIAESCVRSLRAFIAAEQTLCERVIRSCLAYYERIAARGTRDTSDDADFPVVESVAKFGELVSFLELHVHPSADGEADLGFEFECSWDEEHGVGARVWGEKVVLVSQAMSILGARESIQWQIEHLGDGMNDERKAR